MIRLRQLSGTDAGRVVDVEGAVVRVGRMQDNEFALDPFRDLEVSARHAVLQHDGVEWSITDVGSKNGTWVNGRRVVRWVVSDGDEVMLGVRGPRIRIELDPAVARSLELEDTVLAELRKPAVPETSRPSDGSSDPRDPPPETLPPPAAEAMEDAELVGETESERTTTRGVPPTVKTTLEREPRATNPSRAARTFDASCFGLVVVSLSFGFALGFGFAIAFVVGR